MESNLYSNENTLEESTFRSGLLRRLAEFRAVNTEDETVLNYFDELEIHPDHIGKYGFYVVFMRCSTFSLSNQVNLCSYKL